MGCPQLHTLHPCAAPLPRGGRLAWSKGCRHWVLAPQHRGRKGPCREDRQDRVCTHKEPCRVRALLHRHGKVRHPPVTLQVCQRHEDRKVPGQRLHNTEVEGRRCKERVHPREPAQVRIFGGILHTRGPDHRRKPRSHRKGEGPPAGALLDTRR